MLDMQLTLLLEGASVFWLAVPWLEVVGIKRVVVIEK